MTPARGSRSPPSPSYANARRAGGLLSVHNCAHAIREATRTAGEQPRLQAPTGRPQIPGCPTPFPTSTLVLPFIGWLFRPVEPPPQVVQKQRSAAAAPRPGPGCDAKPPVGFRRPWTGRLRQRPQKRPPGRPWPVRRIDARPNARKVWAPVPPPEPCPCAQRDQTSPLPIHPQSAAPHSPRACRPGIKPIRAAAVGRCGIARFRCSAPPVSSDTFGPGIPRACCCGPTPYWFSSHPCAAGSPVPTPDPPALCSRLSDPLERWP